MDESPQPFKQPSAFGSDAIATSHPKRKKTLIIIGIIILVLAVSGGGFSYWTIQNRNQQLAAAAKIEAQRQAKAAAEAKAREGTVSDLQAAFDAESKEPQELNDRFIFSAADTLKQEADAAAIIGTGNEDGI